MSALSESSFTALEHFALAWRWTQPSHAVLPAEALAKIRPLTTDATATLAAEAAARCRPDADAIDERFLASAAAPELETVSARLAALPIRPIQEVVVLWATHVAVLTEWSVFVTYWDDFCYPSSDDVSVWSPGEAWTVYYQHDEIFVFQQGASLTDIHIPS